ncbi:DNA polymerase interacting tpr containing protein of 47kD isoform X2 [Oratosquilla oratoria]
MADDWKEKIIQEKLGGKRDWTDEERMELCNKLDKEMEERLESMEKGTANIKDRWTEDNWEEKMGEHPLFAPYLQKGKTDGEAPLNSLSEGLAQLKYAPDHNTPQELAQNYKEEGINHFKYKKYRLSIGSFTEAIKQKCEDVDLNATLYNNRAAAHWHLGNYRSAIKDCEKAVELKPDYSKALMRAVQCTLKLKTWDECISWCDRGLKLNGTDQDLLNYRTTAVKEKKKIERDIRKKQIEEKKKTKEEQTLLSAIETRGTRLRNKNQTVSVLSLSDLEPCHPSAMGSKVHLNEEGQLIWPVLFLYPEYHETDFIQEFNETQCFEDHLSAMFGNHVPPPPWDTEEKYKVENLLIYFEDYKANKLIPIDPAEQLYKVLMDSRYQVVAGTPSFIVLVEGSEAKSEFLRRYE